MVAGGFSGFTTNTRMSLSMREALELWAEQLRDIVSAI